MKHFKFMGAALLALAAAGVSSCSTTSKTALRVKEFRATQPQEAHVLTHMVAADLEVDPSRKKLEINYTKAEMKALGANIEMIRRDACARACQQYGADVWVGAIYTIESEDLKNGLKLTLTGYPAKYRSWKNAELSDTLLYHEMVRSSKK